MAQPVVIDNGSGAIKVGFAESEVKEPKKIFPTIIGRPNGNSNDGILIGDKVISEEKLKQRFKKKK